MKNLLVVAFLALAGSANAAYLQNILQDPKHPQISANGLFTMKGAGDGGSLSAAVIFHKADPNDTIIPQRLLDLGVKPVSWAPLAIGGGGNRDHAFGTIGASANFAPTLLGPLAQALDASGKSFLSKLLVSPDDSGLNLGLCWKADAVRDGTILPLNRWAFAPRFTVGGVWRF